MYAHFVLCVVLCSRAITMKYVMGIAMVEKFFMSVPQHTLSIDKNSSATDQVSLMCNCTNFNNNDLSTSG